MKWLLIIWTAGMAVVFWSPLPPGGPSLFGHTDLLIHWGLFAGLGFLLHEWRQPCENRFYWIDWGFTLLLVAMVMESVQWLVPGRSVQLLDYAVNCLGGWSAGAIAFQNRLTARWIGASVLSAGTIGLGSIVFVGGESFLGFMHQFDQAVELIPAAGMTTAVAVPVTWMAGRWLMRPGRPRSILEFALLVMAGILLLTISGSFQLAGGGLLLGYLLLSRTPGFTCNSLARLGLMALFFSLLIFFAAGYPERLQHFGLYWLIGSTGAVVFDLLWRSTGVKGSRRYPDQPGTDRLAHSSGQS